MTGERGREQHRGEPQRAAPVERARQRAQEEQREREREHERVLARERAREGAAHDVQVERLRGVAAVLEVEERGRAHRDHRRGGTRRAQAAQEHVGPDRQQQRPERGDELERDVVGQDDVEGDDQQRREREVELPGREARVVVGGPAGESPRQQVVAQERGEPHVRAGVASGQRGVAQELARLELDEQEHAARRDDGDADPVLESVPPLTRRDRFRRRREDPRVRRRRRPGARRCPRARSSLRQHASRRSRSGRAGYSTAQSLSASSGASGGGCARARGRAVAWRQRTRARSSTCPSGIGPSAVSHVWASHFPHRRNVTSRSATRIRISTMPGFEHREHCISGPPSPVPESGIGRSSRELEPGQRGQRRARSPGAVWAVEASPRRCFLRSR